MKRKVLIGVAIAVLVAAVVATCCDSVISRAARGRNYDSIDAVPHRTTALLLGTGPVSRWGGKNHYFLSRIDAAAKLYAAGKCDSIIVSGTRSGEYNEPDTMISCLAQAGVPRDRCVPDYEGFTTIRSIERAHDVFHQDSVLIISQKFHNERAIFMARDCGLDAVGYNAGNYYGGRKRRIMQMGRERISRIKAVAQSLF